MPVILFAVGSAYAIHVLAHYYRHAADSSGAAGPRRPSEAVLRALKGTGPTVLAAGLTTVVSLLSFVTMDLRPMRMFGWFAALGVFITLVLSLTFVPAVANIIGFPSDTETAILERLQTLKMLDPDVTTFYIMTPIPGTDQYEDLRARGLLTKSNLDRFDTTCLTWRHPQLTDEQLRDLLFRVYREFYSGPHMVTKLLRARRRHVALLHGLAIWWFGRFAGRRRLHPMAGGIGRVRSDGVADYLPLRRKLFGFDLAPLPTSLALSAVDQAINRTAKLCP